MSKPNWLPNLVGGVSIWKLAQDLNQPRFFDGRLLVPETEGSESLPTSVTWDLTSLVPLREARTSHPAEVDRAIADFLACLDVVSKELASEGSGYFKFRDALTFPRGLDGAEEGDAYYFDPSSGRLKVINWGASPREIAGTQKLVFGWEDWGALRKAGAVAVAGAVLAGASAAAVAGAVPSPAPTDKKDDKNDEKPKDKQDTKKRRPWWQWLLVALAALVLVLLLVWLLRSCVSCDSQVRATDGATDGLVEGAAVAEAGFVDGADATGGDATDADPDGVADGATDATDAGDGGDAAKKDGAADDDDDDDDPGGGGGGIGSGGGGGIGSGGGGGGGGGTPGPTDRPKLHAVHPDAVRWKVSRGTQLLHKGQAVTGQGRTFDVTLRRGKSFRDVTVEWQDKKGVWHTF